MASKFGSSDKAFGLVFAAVFVIIAAWPWFFHNQPPRLWAMIVSFALALVAFLTPRILAPLNRLWLQFGLLLHHIANPVLMALIYYGAVVPMGLVMRMAGKDLLRLKRNPNLASYWIARDPPGPSPDSMSKQF